MDLSLFLFCFIDDLIFLYSFFNLSLASSDNHFASIGPITLASKRAEAKLVRSKIGFSISNPIPVHDRRGVGRVTKAQLSSPCHLLLSGHQALPPVLRDADGSIDHLQEHHQAVQPEGPVEAKDMDEPGVKFCRPKHVHCCKCPADTRGI